MLKVILVAGLPSHFGLVTPGNVVLQGCVSLSQENPDVVLGNPNKLEHLLIPQLFLSHQFRYVDI